jgi:predicted enzyme related to lactoylglutathione lyase
MAENPARFVWYELMTNDSGPATQFYTNVVGWTAQVTDMTGSDYTLLMAGATACGGLTAVPAEAASRGARPGWVGYVAVAELDDAVRRWAEQGGAVRRPPDDIPSVGRFAVVADPQGAVLLLFQPFGAPPGPELAPGTPGRVAWHELATSDWPKALAFYGEMFAWTASGAMDMGEMGTYQMFAAGSATIGGMFNKPPSVPVSGWLYYIQVADIDAAAQRVTQGGGSVVHGPSEVPGGEWILRGVDPQGAMFALVGKRVLAS